MKILCDVCNKEESTVFCSADEAALCGGCDQRVHGANKLASKHDRHALSPQTSRGSPLCDICQEGRALFFCREDRAILCRGCDLHIHVAANKYSRNHSRFLLAGVGISMSTSSSQSSPSPYGLDDAVLDMGWDKDRVTLPSQLPVKTEEIHTSLEYPESCSNPVNLQDDEYSATSSISEYFTKTLPGWRVDDFLDPYQPHFHGYSKTFDDLFLTEEDSVGSFISNSSGAITLAAKPHNWAQSRRTRKKLGYDAPAVPSTQWQLDASLTSCHFPCCACDF